MLPVRLKSGGIGPLLAPITVIAFYLWLFLFNLRPIQGHDIWWHLASGRYIVQHAVIPRIDPFSICQGSLWVDSYWLSEIFIYLGYVIGGLNAIIVGKSLIVLAIIAMQDIRLNQNRVPGVIRYPALAALFFAAHPRGFGWSEQASLATFLFLSFLIWQLDDSESFWKFRVRFWPLIFILWANMHRGFILGLVILTCAAISDSQFDRRELFKRLGWTAACALAVLVTPYGYRLLTMIRDDLRLSPSFVMGWAQTPFAHLELFWGSIPILWASLIYRWRNRTPDLNTAAVALFLTGIAIRHYANMPYLMLFAWPLIALTIWQAAQPMGAENWLRKVELPLLVIGLISLLALMGRAPVRGGVNKGIFPVEACDFVAKNKITGQVYNDYRFGGYWLWRFGGERKVFIDGRYPAVLGYEQLFHDIMKAQNGSPADWNKFLADHGVDFALVPYLRSETFPSVSEAYFPRSHWAMVYWDDLAYIFVRRTPANRAAIQTNEFAAVWPDSSESHFMDRYRNAPIEARRRIRAELRRNQAIHPDSRRTQHWMGVVNSISDSP